MDDFALRGHEAMSRDILIVTAMREGVLLASGGWSPGTLLNTPQRPGRPTAESHPAPDVSSGWPGDSDTQ